MIDYLENNKQNLSSHLELVIWENSQFFVCYLSKNKQKIEYFPKITSSRWQEENNRNLFSVPPGIVHNQGLPILPDNYNDKSNHYPSI